MLRQKSMAEIMNEVILRGRVARIRGEGTNGTVILACPAITTTRKEGKLLNGVKVNFPVLSFNKNTNTQDIANNFTVGEHVIVKGYVQSYLRMDEKTGEVKEVMNVYIREMLPDSSKMQNAFGVNGRFYPDAQNEVYLSGPIAGISKRGPRVTNIRLDLSGEKKNMINAVCFNASDELLSGLGIGTVVNLLAMVQTVDVNDGKKPLSYQQLVVLDMAAAQ